MNYNDEAATPSGELPSAFRVGRDPEFADCLLERTGFEPSTPLGTSDVADVIEQTTPICSTRIAPCSSRDQSCKLMLKDYEGARRFIYEFPRPFDCTAVEPQRIELLALSDYLEDRLPQPWPCAVLVKRQC